MASEAKLAEFRSLLLGIMPNHVPEEIIDDLFIRMRSDIEHFQAEFNAKVDRFREDLGDPREFPEGTHKLDEHLLQWKMQKKSAIITSFADQVAQLVTTHAPGHGFTRDETLDFITASFDEGDTQQA